MILKNLLIHKVVYLWLSNKCKCVENENQVPQSRGLKEQFKKHHPDLPKPKLKKLFQFNLNKNILLIIQSTNLLTIK